jgi:hypothetical protein
MAKRSLLVGNVLYSTKEELIHGAAVANDRHDCCLGVNAAAVGGA